MAKEAHDYTDLDKLRHSCAHVLAQAVKSFWPQAKLGVGPPVDHGFFYDIDLDHRLTDEDLLKIEAKMREIVKANYPYIKKEVPRPEAIDFFKKANEPYKLDIIDRLPADEKVTLVVDGDFTDLCKNPHVHSTGEIKALKLLNVSGAYWRGIETNPMMQRVYGTAFFSQKELDDSLKAIEEAKKRDHRKLGRELDLFSIQEEAGPGLVFYHPKGAMLRYLVEQFVREEHLKREYLFVGGPQILKSDVWKTSGHYDYYKENMFIHEAEDGKEYGIKPMNCPGHMLIYKTQTRSYRQFPLRFFELGNVCRNEKSGALHGLLRVRNFTQDDAHIFCLPDQLEAEIGRVIDFMFYILGAFGFTEYEIELSTRPKESIGTDEIWAKATEALRGALEKKGLKYGVAPEGGAFYGPKIDLRIKDALGRAWQCSTIQCDFALPEKFELEYASTEGDKKRPVMLHRAILGSVERFLGTLVEHYAGAFPLWVSPVQVALVPVTEKHGDYAHQVLKRFEAAKIRGVFLEANDSLGKRVRHANEEKIPYTLVVGDKEAEAGTVTVRRRGSRDQNAMSVEDFLKKIETEIGSRDCSF
jgi:threonyl-tRNA synthetase